MLTVPAFARASAQISSYEITASTSSNTIWVEFYVDANTMMEKIGCESVDLYELSGTKWILCESLDEKDSGMSRSNARAFSNDIEFDAEKGVEYKVVVTVFADDGSERDTRTRTFYVTGK
ncbi:hypothetical protein K440107A6_37990 [Lawsonibacter asaccharolyticus]|jgi:hypothetical protein